MKDFDQAVTAIPAEVVDVTKSSGGKEKFLAALCRSGVGAACG